MHENSSKLFMHCKMSKAKLSSGDFYKQADKFLLIGLGQQVRSC